MGSLVVAVYPIAGALLPIRSITETRTSTASSLSGDGARVVPLRACTVWRLPRDDRIDRRGEIKWTSARIGRLKASSSFRSAEAHTGLEGWPKGDWLPQPVGAGGLGLPSSGGAQQSTPATRHPEYLFTPLFPIIDFISLESNQVRAFDTSATSWRMTTSFAWSALPEHSPVCDAKVTEIDRFRVLFGRFVRACPNDCGGRRGNVCG